MQSFIIALIDGNGTSLSSSDRSGNINIRINRDDNGSITGIETTTGMEL